MQESRAEPYQTQVVANADIQKIMAPALEKKRKGFFSSPEELTEHRRQQTVLRDARRAERKRERQARRKGR